jgi:S-phase kinase-associated protein 1
MDEEINETKIVKLKSMPDENGDVRVFEVTYGAARISELVRDSVGGTIEDDEESELPLEVDVLRVKGDCLERVVDFMKHFNEEKMKEIPTPLGGSSFNEVSSNDAILACIESLLNH